MREEEKAPATITIFLPEVVIATINLSAICILDNFYLETKALYFSTPIRDGGLGLSPCPIGTFASIRAVVLGLSQLFIFPRGHDKVYSHQFHDSCCGL